LKRYLLITAFILNAFSQIFAADSTYSLSDGFESATLNSNWTHVSSIGTFGLEDTLVHSGSKAFISLQADVRYIFPKSFSNGQISWWYYDNSGDPWTYFYALTDTTTDPSNLTNNNLNVVTNSPTTYSFYYPTVGYQNTIQRSTGWHQFFFAIKNGTVTSGVDGKTGITYSGSPPVFAFQVSSAIFDDFSVVSNPSAPTAPVLVSPVSGSLNVPLSTSLNWDSSSYGYSYHVEVASDSLFSNLLVNDSTPTAITQYLGGLTNSTVYFWRVSVKNSAGTSPWSTGGKFTTVSNIPAPPSAPLQTSPTNGSVNVPVSQNLTWNISTGATSYMVEVATDSLFSNIILNDSGLTTTTQSTGTLLNNASYFWRVSAKNTGGSSPFSTVWKFTTIPAIPAAPTLVSPAQLASNIALSTSLSWNAVSGATSYRVQLATDSLFTAIIVNDSGLITTSQAIGPLTNNTTYYWRVNATNAGGTSAYSTIFKFTSIPATPGVPVLTSPPNGSTNISTTTALDWAALTNAVSYVLELSSDSNFQSYLVFDSNLTSISQVVGPLPNNGIFYWRVKGVNSNNVSSNWSLTWKYSTVPNPPTAPLQLTPAQNASIFDSTTFSWVGYVNSTSYDLQIATDSLFTQVFRDTTQTTTSVKIKNLLNGFTLYWRVNATGPGGISAWSNTGIFTTLTSAGIFQRPVQKAAVKKIGFDGTVILDGRVMVNGKSVGSTSLKEGN